MRPALHTASARNWVPAIPLGVLLALAVTPAATAGAGPTLTATATPAEIPIGAGTAVSGALAGEPAAVAGQVLELEAAPYPFRRFAPVEQAQSAADGSFAFAATAPLENTRLRVRVSSAPALVSPAFTVTVDPRIAVHAAILGPGRERLSTRIVHFGEGGPGPVSWYLAPQGSRHFSAPAASTSRELSPGVSYASVIVNPPARHFTYRVCLKPAWAPAMGPASEHGNCPGHGVALSGKGSGIPAAPYPSAGAIAAAGSWLAARAGSTALAVLDSSGKISGRNLNERFETASVIKVMFLTAYLQMLSAQHRSLTPSDNALLYPMIHESNNEDASAVLAAVGESSIERVAREAGMRDYTPGVGWWAYSYTSAADQVRFFLDLAHLIPSRFWGYARGLMSGIEAEQSWGFPPVARPQWQVFFKTGALPEEGLFNEVARLERGPITFTVAVFTDGEPSQAYGEETIEGVARRLLAHTP